MNYLFSQNKVYMLDLESSREHANPVHDLALLPRAQVLFCRSPGDGRMAEPYIGHYLWRYSRNEPEFYSSPAPFLLHEQGLLRMARLSWDQMKGPLYFVRQKRA